MLVGKGFYSFPTRITFSCLMKMYPILANSYKSSKLRLRIGFFFIVFIFPPFCKISFFFILHTKYIINFVLSQEFLINLLTFFVLSCKLYL